MMTAGQARSRAEQILADLGSSVGRELAVWDKPFGQAGIEDHGDVWTVAWNSVAYLEGGVIFDQVLSGPLAIPKDGSDHFILGTWSNSAGEMLERRRRETAEAGEEQ